MDNKPSDLFKPFDIHKFANYYFGRIVVEFISRQELNYSLRHIKNTCDGATTSWKSGVCTIRIPDLGVIRLQVMPT